MNSDGLFSPFAQILRYQIIKRNLYIINEQILAT